MAGMFREALVQVQGKVAAVTSELGRVATVNQGWRNLGFQQARPPPPTCVLFVLFSFAQPCISLQPMTRARPEHRHPRTPPPPHTATR